ncbi:TPA: FecCD family ABC transporter permease [Streptococcus pneumoniae]
MKKDKEVYDKVCEYLSPHLNKDMEVLELACWFRVIIVIEANSYVNIRSSRLLPKFKTQKITGILGINTGASLSVVIGLSFLGISSSISHISFAIIGGLVSAIFVYAIAVSGKAGLTPIKLALSGTCVSMALSSFVSFLILPNNNVLDKFRFWQIGSLGAATLSSISTLLPFIILGHLIAIFISSDLNALAMGDEMAVGLGVNVNRIRSLAIIASVLLCSSITAIGGPIGFVGLIVPHFCGLFISKDIRTMTISSSFIGAELLLICDIIGRMLGKPGEIEVGIITAIIGGPVLIYVTMKNRGVNN